MANLKLDIIKIYSDNKMYAELELVRLAQEPNMNYKNKLNLMDEELNILIKSNAKIELINQYFQEPAPQAAPAPQQEAAPAPAPVPAGTAHKGQSHGEG